MAIKSALSALLITGLVIQYSNAISLQEKFDAANALLTTLQGAAGIGAEILADFKKDCGSSGKFLNDQSAFDTAVVDLVDKYNQSFSLYKYYPQDPSTRNILKDAIETYLNAFKGSVDTLIPAESELKAILQKVQ